MRSIHRQGRIVPFVCYTFKWFLMKTEVKYQIHTIAFRFGVEVNFQFKWKLNEVEKMRNAMTNVVMKTPTQSIGG